MDVGGIIQSVNVTLNLSTNKAGLFQDPIDSYYHLLLVGC